ncbi:MAG: pro-sigmaK processing inhibitor BofA family protein [Clostridiales bacterium]|nr:pro-sigmaK processing inhibitor BofA family protein [Clostridiales bacterium]
MTMIKTKHGFKAILSSVVLGVIALFGINLFSSFTGVSIGVNAVSIFVSCIASIPGVIMLLLVNTMFSI